MARILSLAVSVAVVLLVLTGCGEDATETGTDAGGVPKAGDSRPHADSASALETPRRTVRVEPKIVPPTDEAAREFAERLEGAIKSGDPSEVEGLIDWDVFRERATRGIELPGGLESELYEGMAGEILPGLVNMVQKTLATGGDYTLLRVRDVSGQKRALFRVRGDDGSVNYGEFFLKRGDGGRVQAYDTLNYLSGETLSEEMRCVILPLAMEQDQDLKGWLDERVPSVLRWMESYKRVLDAISAEQPREALDVYHGLPEEFRLDKRFLTLRLGAAKLLKDDEEYLRASEALYRLDPASPTVDLVSVDYFLLNGRHEEALAALQRLDRTVGGDGHLHVLMANVYSEMGRPDDAKRTLEKAIAIEPTLEDAYSSMVFFCLEQGQFDGVLKWLKESDRRFPAEWNDLRDVPEFTEFVQSPQHGAWLKYLRRKEAP